MRLVANVHCWRLGDKMVSCRGAVQRQCWALPVYARQTGCRVLLAGERPRVDIILPLFSSLCLFFCLRDLLTSKQ